MKTAFLSLGVACLLTGCADNAAIITGHVHPATTPDKVQVYLQPPMAKYEVIGLVSASSKNKSGITRQGKTDAALRALKEKAAEIGANGILLQGQGTESSGAITSGGRGAFVKTGFNDIAVDGTAIYIP